jgi:putative transposase
MELARIVLFLPLIVMTMPREIHPGTDYLITRRCTQRQFLLRPDDETNNAFLYCLAVAAERYGIDVIISIMMSNHHHTAIRDNHGNVSEFMEHFHKLLARCMNCYRGRTENFFSSEEPSLVRLVDRADVINKVVYAATNPVKDFLVARVADWPGVNGLDALLGQRVLKAVRPTHFFSADGDLPETVELRMVVPSHLGEPQEFLDEVAHRVVEFESAYDRLRESQKRSVVGRYRILRQSWRDSPSTDEPRRGIRPRVASRNKWSRLATLLRRRVFLDSYRAARHAWRAGAPIPFPAGTYWLRRFMNVPVVADGTDAGLNCN